MPIYASRSYPFTFPPSLNDSQAWVVSCLFYRLFYRLFFFFFFSFAPAIRGHNALPHLFGGEVPDEDPLGGERRDKEQEGAAIVMRTPMALLTKKKKGTQCREPRLTADSWTKR